MGCGQSKIGSLYSRNKAKHKKSLQPPAPSASGTGGGGGGGEDDGGGGGDTDGEGGSSSTPASPSASAEAEARRKALASRVRQVLSSGPLLAQAEVSSSQLDFFKMLDERIENGPDYVSGSDEEALSVPERQSSLPEDDQNSRQESQSLTSQPEKSAEDYRGATDEYEGIRRVDASKGVAISAPSCGGDGVKTPVMNGELRRWDAPPTTVTEGGHHHGNGVQGPKTKTTNNPRNT